MTAPAPEEKLVRDARRLERELQAMETRFGATVDDFREAVSGEVTRPLQEALAAARDAHDRLLDEAGLTPFLHPVEEGAPATPAPGWTALRRYRQGVLADVLAPLESTLARLEPGTGLGDAVDDLAQDLQGLAEGAPEALDRPEPEGLYAVRSGDGPLVAAGKLAVRGGRMAGSLITAPVRGVTRLLGAPSPPPLRVQRISLRALAADVLRGGEPAALSRIAHELWQHHARPLARVEGAVAEWNRSWLAAETVLQPADGLLDPELARNLAHVRDQALHPPSHDEPDEVDDGSGPPEGEGGETGGASAGLEDSAGSHGRDTGSGSTEEPAAEAGALDDPDGTDEEAGARGAAPAAPGVRDAGGADGAEDPGAPAEDVDFGVPPAARHAPAGLGPEEVMAGAHVAARNVEAAETDERERRRAQALTGIRGAIRALAAALQDAARLEESAAFAQEVERFGARTWERFIGAVDASDTFFAAGDRRSRDRRFERSRQHRDRRREIWSGWFDGARARLTFAVALLELRSRWDEIHGGLLSDVGHQGIVELAEEWLHARDHLMALHWEARRAGILRPGQLENRRAEAAERLDEWRHRALDELREHLLEPLEEQQAASAIRRLVDQAAEALAALARTVPEEIELNLPQSGDGEVVPSVGRRVVALREITEETLDAFRIEAVRQAPAPLLSILEEAKARSTAIPEVVEYNLSAARDEVLQEEEDETREEDGDDGDGPGWEEEVRELTLQGLERTAQGVETLLSIFPPAWDRFASSLQSALPSAYADLHRRAVAEGVVREQFLDLRSFFRRQRRVGWAELRALFGRGAEWVRRHWRRIRPQLRGLLRMGRAAVGVAPAEGEEERAIEVLRSIPELVAPLPLVYRRLFSFQPVTDASLLAGRSEETEWIRDRYAGWSSGRPLPAMLVAAPGAGITSLYNAWEETVFPDAVTSRLDFDRRIETETQLAEIMAGALGLEGSFESLDAVARTQAGREDDGPRIVLLEGLEYLHLRGVASASLLGNLLNFQAHTSSSVFWISSMSDAAWSLFRVRQPVAATLVALLEVAPLSRGDIEASILLRHRRSGLPLVFLPPQDLSPLKARKLRRTRDPEEKQALLQEDFFDRVHRLSMASPAMADVIWLRSLDLASQEGQARVRAPRPIRFAFLEALTPAIDFALMAFMEHGSLTLGEYRRILHAEDEEVLRIFEALRTRMLLQSVSDADMIPRPVDFLEVETSYRIPQILGMAVSERLRSLNILH